MTSSFGVDIAVIQETHFVLNVDVGVLSNDFLVYSAYGVRRARGVSLLIKRTLDEKADLVHIVDIAVKSASLRHVALHAPND